MREYSTPMTVEVPTTGNLTDAVVDTLVARCTEPYARLTNVDVDGCAGVSNNAVDALWTALATTVAPLSEEGADR